MKMQLSCGCCDPPVITTWERMLSLVEPLNSDSTLSGYTREWVNVVSAGYRTRWRGLITSDDVDAMHDVFGSAPPYEIKFRPVRWRIGSDRTLNDTYGTSAVAGSYWEERLFFSRNARRFVPGIDTTPPADLQLDLSDVLTVQPPFWETCPTNNGSRVSHFRLLINGVDATGIVEINQAVNLFTDGFWSNLGTADPMLCAAHSFEVAGGIPADATIEIDYWYVLSLARTQVDTYTIPFNEDPPMLVGAIEGSTREQQPGFIVGFPRSHTLVGTGSLQSGALNGRYKFEFSGATVSGQSELVSRGSLWVKENGAYLYLDPETSEEVQFYFSEEIATLFVRKRIGTPGLLISMRYLIQGYDYPAVQLYNSSEAPSFSSAIFNPDEPMVFSRAGLESFGTIDLGHVEYPADFPESITVSRP